MPALRTTPSVRIDLIITLLVAPFIYLLLFKLPADPFFMQGDQLIFMENAERMLRGEAIYRDFFQFTFPGGQLLYVVLFAIFGVKYWVVGLATLVMGLGFFYSIVRVSRLVMDGPLVYLGPVLFMFFGFRWFGPDGSHRSFGLLLAFIAGWIVLRSSGHLMLVIAGFAAGLSSFFTQQRGGQALVAVMIFVLVNGRMSGVAWMTAVRALLILAGSYAISLVALCGYFIATAGLGNFTWATIIYPAKYYHYHDQNNIGTFFLEIERAFGPGSPQAIYVTLTTLFYSIVIPLTVTAFFLLFWRKRREHDWNYWRGPLLLALLGGVLIAGTPNPNGVRYFQVAAPALVLFAWLIRHTGVFQRHMRLSMATLTLILVAITTTQIHRMQTHWAHLPFETPTGTLALHDDDITRPYVWLRDHTQAGDYFYEVNNPFMSFPLGLRNPARYSQVYPTDYTRPEQVLSVVEDLKARPPKYIFWDNSYNKPAIDRSSGDHTGPLAEFIQAEYVPASEVFYRGPAPLQFWERHQK